MTRNEIVAKINSCQRNITRLQKENTICQQKRSGCEVALSKCSSQLRTYEDYLRKRANRVSGMQSLVGKCKIAEIFTTGMTSLIEGIKAQNIKSQLNDIIGDSRKKISQMDGEIAENNRRINRYRSDLQYWRKQLQIYDAQAKAAAENQ